MQRRNGRGIVHSWKICIFNDLKQAIPMMSTKKISIKKEIKRQIVALLVIIAIPFVINLAYGDLDQFKSVLDFIDENSFGVVVGIVCYLGNEIIWIVTRKKLNWLGNPAKANLISLLSFITYGMLAGLIVGFVFHKYIWLTPANRLIDSILSKAFIVLTVDLTIVSIFYSRFIVRYWIASIKNEEKLKHESLVARYEALKNQVNPHFLFNTLNTLTGVVEKNPEKASEFIRKLSDIYRYVLEQKDKELIQIKEEMIFVQDYIYLSKIRYGDGLYVEYHVDNDNYMIVPLGLQMLIENAIKHNIISSDQPLKVEIGTDKNFISIRNNLQRKSTVGHANQIGLENLIKRYAYLSDTKVEIIETKTHFEVKLPLLKNE
jgi:hypothetical protein